jgi:hypothetical protein
MMVAKELDNTVLKSEVISTLHDIQPAVTNENPYY